MIVCCRCRLKLSKGTIIIEELLPNSNGSIWELCISTDQIESRDSDSNNENDDLTEENNGLAEEEDITDYSPYAGIIHIMQNTDSTYKWMYEGKLWISNKDMVNIKMTCNKCTINFTNTICGIWNIFIDQILDPIKFEGSTI